MNIIRKSFRQLGVADRIMLDIMKYKHSRTFHKIHFGYDLKIFYQKLQFTLKLRITEKYKVLQDKVIDKIEENNEIFYDFFSSVLEDLNELSSKIEDKDKRNVYVDTLTGLEKIINKIEDQLLKMREILYEGKLKNIKDKKIEGAINFTNRNMNVLDTIREKIDLIDDTTDDTRHYLEINKKYNLYSKILLVLSVTFIAFSLLDYSVFPRESAIGVLLINIVALWGIYISKINTLKTHFSQEL